MNTLWGELAYQLGGPQGYALIASSDEQRVAPGAQDLAALFTAHAPCLILVDEWVAYARNLVCNSTLPAGTFGLLGASSLLYVFGSGTDPGVPAGVRLLSPGRDSREPRAC